MMVCLILFFIHPVYVSLLNAKAWPFKATLSFKQHRQQLHSFFVAAHGDGFGGGDFL
jgi:membrane-bound metal-dependent hydrolase YbcI (DUF457 family)